MGSWCEGTQPIVARKSQRQATSWLLARIWADSDMKRGPAERLGYKLQAPLSPSAPLLPTRSHPLKVLQSPNTGALDGLKCQNTCTSEDISHFDRGSLLCGLFWALCYVPLVKDSGTYCLPKYLSPGPKCLTHNR